MQTIGYVWNADIRVCVECRHSDSRAANVSAREHELSKRKEESVFSSEHVTAMSS